jgi:hypothetical protein
MTTQADGKIGLKEKSRDSHRAILDFDRLNQRMAREPPILTSAIRGQKHIPPKGTEQSPDEI